MINTSWRPLRRDVFEPGVPLTKAISAAGENYLTDRVVAVRADLVDVSWSGQARHIPSRLVVPAVMPPPSPARFRASALQRLLEAGLAVCGVSRSSPQHLYLGGEHVGWVQQVHWAHRRGPIMGLADMAAVFEQRMNLLTQPADGGPAVLGGTAPKPSVRLEHGVAEDVAAFVVNEIRHALASESPQRRSGSTRFAGQSDMAGAAVVGRAPRDQAPEGW